MTAAVLPVGGFSAVRPAADRALGPDGARLRELLHDALDTNLSLAFGKRYVDLQKAYSEASVEDWDGYGARPADPAGYHRAAAFLRALPVTVPDPDITVDPDGEIALTWHRAPRLVFSVSIGRGAVSYAGLFGGSTTHGTEPFTDELPRAIEVNLARLFAQGS